MSSYESLRLCVFLSELRDREIRIPAEMVQNLMLLHSYILVKVGHTDTPLAHTLLQGIVLILNLKRGGGWQNLINGGPVPPPP